MNPRYQRSFHQRPAGASRFVRIARVLGALILVGGVFVGAVWLFRRDAGGETVSESEGATVISDNQTEATSEVRERKLLDNTFANNNPLVNTNGVTISLTALFGNAASGTATRTHADGLFSLTILSQLPAIDTATMTYEAWFVKPGITDFFSLGQMYPREDGQWGLVWESTDNLVRSDIEEFSRLLITREARDGNTAPSTDQVLGGEFN